MEAAPHLHLIDTATGEVEERCPDCLNYERQNRALMRQRTSLENEIAELQGAEPESETVREALVYWSRRVVEEGWWSRFPKFKPGDERWTACRARQKEGRTVDDCNLAVDGALSQGRKADNGRPIERAWVDATSIFRNNKNFEQHLERALDPARQWVRAVQQVPTGLRDRWAEVVDLAATCDCGHIRLDHERYVPGHEDERCLVHGCDCLGWDDFHQVADAFIRGQDG